MAARDDNDLYDKVVRVTNVYLGPTADRFIARQIQHHLHKAPEELSQSDLSQLIDWMQVTVSLLTEDSEVVEEYTDQLRKLARTDGDKKNKQGSSDG